MKLQRSVGHDGPASRHALGQAVPNSLNASLNEGCISANAEDLIPASAHAHGLAQTKGALE